MIFLGYEIDSILMQIRLPLDKLERCSELIGDSLAKEKIKLRELQRIIGTLNFACAVIQPGRSFLRRLINLSVGVRRPHHHIRITKGAREDLKAWKLFLDNFNGKSLFLPDKWLHSPSIHLYTDASGSIGYGLVLNKKWAYGVWDENWVGRNITLLELYPIWLAIRMWGGTLANKCIYFHTDNEALVAIINKQSSPDPLIMFLIRKLVVDCLLNNILFKSVHIRGVHNVLSDALSRGQVMKFRALVPTADPHPTPVPPLPELPN